MSTVEKLENNKMKLTFAVDAQTFEKGLDYSYKKKKGSINLPGFRKGKIPRNLIESQFGIEFLFDDAINFVFPDAYEKILDENNIEPVSRPTIDVPNASKEDGVEFIVEIVVKPEITVSDYKGLKYTKVETDVTDEEIEAEIEKMREQNARISSVSDRPTKDGDTAVIDYEGFVGDEAFAGGKGSDHELVLGSNSFIDTFEEQLVGKNVGDDVDVNVKFPDEYHSPDLAGKEALFKVKVKDIKEKILPELDDEFAQDVSEFDTLDEYKNDVKEKLSNAKKESADREKYEKVMQSLVEIVEADIPTEMFDNQKRQMVNNMKQRIRGTGMDFDMYLQYLGQTEEKLMESYQENAENQVRARLALESIVRIEKYEVSDDELNEEITKMAEAYKMTLEQLLEVMPDAEKDVIRMDLKIKKAADMVVETAVEIEA